MAEVRQGTESLLKEPEEQKEKEQEEEKVVNAHIKAPNRVE